jgi:ABC-2 type transport system permease protein
MWNQASAIVWAQWRSLRNRFPRANKAGLAFTTLLSALWYGVFAYLAIFAVVLLANPEEVEPFRRILPAALLICFLYWQVIPVLMASMGSSLDLRKLLVYPIPKGQLFTVEVVLRISTGVEMLLLMLGAAIGLLLNPKIPGWAPLALALFVVFNLLCSAGVRDLLVRLLARKRVREVVIFLVVLAAALPQLLLFRGSGIRVRQFFAGDPSELWPWTAAARLALGQLSVRSVAVLLAWTVAGYVFGRWQFERGLRFDVAEAASKDLFTTRRASRLEWLYQLPNALFPDPLATLMEKELRFLSRAPRFRLVFLMGFSFGLMIWAPLAFAGTNLPRGFLSDNYLTLVSVYALLLLSDVLFWNCFGFDRSAAQVYFLVPVKMSTVLVGKNLAASFFVLLEITAIALVCALLRLPLSGRQILEAFSVTCVITLFILTVGNLSSLYSPRPVNPARSFRTTASSRIQAMLMLAFPVALAPIALAYLARYAFDTEWAFLGVLLFGGILGAIVYNYSLDAAVKAAGQRTEEIISTLSRGEGPIES